MSFLARGRRKVSRIHKRVGEPCIFIQNGHVTPDIYVSLLQNRMLSGTIDEPPDRVDIGSIAIEDLPEIVPCQGAKIVIQSPSPLAGCTFQVNRLQDHNDVRYNLLVTELK